MGFVDMVGRKPRSGSPGSVNETLLRYWVLSLLGGLILLACLMLGSSSYALAWTGSGSGTAADPYLISSSAHLINISEQVDDGVDFTDKYFKQTGNIVFQPTEIFTVIGNYNNRFNGNYDGSNFTISGIRINHKYDDYQGLFGCVDSGGKINNVNLADCIIVGKDFVGNIVGLNYGIVTNCSCASSITLTGVNYVGGLVGSNATYGIVEECCNSGSITGDTYVGGVIGRSNNGTLRNSFNNGSVMGRIQYVAGVVGYNSNGTVKNCYNTGSVSGTASGIGGVIGFNSGIKSVVTNTYFLQSAGLNVSLSGIGSPASNSGAMNSTAASIQIDGFAYNLNTTGSTSANSGIWSRNPDRNSGYPIIADENNCAIYKVSFVNDGVAYSTGYSDYSARVLLPLTPSKAGYGFGGWYSGANGTGTAFLLATSLISDLTVNAHWYQDPGDLPVLETFGTEVRNESPSGMRFKTRLYKNQFFNSDRITQYGTIILPSAHIAAGETLTLETVPSNYVSNSGSRILVIPAVNIYSENDDYLVFTAVLTDIPTEQAGQDITAVAYVKYLDNSGVTQTVYSTAMTSSLNAVNGE